MQSTTPATQSNPPDAIERATETLGHEARAPLPSSGPVMYESCSMLAMRPRSVGGIVSFQSVIRNRPLTMSAAPASARQATATGNERAKPSAKIARPQTRLRSRSQRRGVARRSSTR